MDSGLTARAGAACRRILRLGRRSSESALDEHHLAPWKIPEKVSRAILCVKRHSMCDPLRLAMLYGLACEVRGLEGDVVECGVCNGGSAAILGAAILNCRDRRLWLYDTFEGIPPPTEKDEPIAQEHTGTMVGSDDAVAEALSVVGFPLERSVFRKGLFVDAFKQALPDKVSLLHVDADWYDGVLLCLETMYPLIPDHGVVVLDDFGHWSGTREAFYDFCVAHGLKPLLERAGYTQAFWRKGQSDCRASRDRYELGIYRPDFGGQQQLER